MKWLSPSTQVWLFLIVLSVTSLILGYELGERLGLFLGFLAAVAIHIFIFVFGDQHLLEFLKAEPLKGHDAWGLLKLTDDLSYELGLQAPEVYLTNSLSPLALVMGHPWRKGHLVLSTSLLEKLSRAELSAVIAHQLGHLHFMDSFQFGVMAGFARLFLGSARFLDQLWPFNWSRQQKQEVFLNLIAPFAWLFLKIALRSGAYLRSDDLAAHVTQDRKALAQALWKMEGLSLSHPVALPPCTSHFFFVDPQGATQTNAWLKSHPPAHVRIKRLIGTETL